MSDFQSLGFQSRQFEVRGRFFDFGDNSVGIWTCLLLICISTIQPSYEKGYNFFLCGVRIQFLNHTYTIYTSSFHATSDRFTITHS